MIAKATDRKLSNLIEQMNAAGEIQTAGDFMKVGRRLAAAVTDDAELATIVQQVAEAYQKVRGTPEGKPLMYLSVTIDVAYQNRIRDMALEHCTAEIIEMVTRMPYLHEVQGAARIVDRLTLAGMEGALETRYPEVRDALDELLPSMEALNADTRPPEVQNPEARAQDLAAYMVAAVVRGDLTTTHRPLAICA